MNEIITYNDLKKGVTYFLTGEFWDFGKTLFGTPVTLVRFEDRNGKKCKDDKAYSAIVKLPDGKLATIFDFLFVNEPIKAQL